MAQTLDRPLSEAAPRRAGARRPAERLMAFVAVATAGALLAAGLLLWQSHGATVFFDMMNAGIASCL